MLWDIADRICLKHFHFFWNVSCAEELENVQPYQHLKPSNSSPLKRHSQKMVHLAISSIDMLSGQLELETAYQCICVAHSLRGSFFRKIRFAQLTPEWLHPNLLEFLFRSGLPCPYLFGNSLRYAWGAWISISAQGSAENRGGNWFLSTN